MDNQVCYARLSPRPIGIDIFSAGEPLRLQTQ